MRVQIKCMNPAFSKHSLSHLAQCAVLEELMELQKKRKDEDWIIQEVRNIVRRSMINTSNILEHLDVYREQEFVLDDEEVETEKIFTLQEIEEICIKYRMSFLDAKYFKKEIPSVAEIKVEYLNETYNKKLKNFMILSYRECFISPNTQLNYGILFAPTLNGHYYLIHQWGNNIPKIRKWLYFPLRSFETLAISVILFTLIVDLLLPTHLITLDRTATYWCGYRLGIYFHLLIFFGGLTMFFVIGFFRNVSKNLWNTI